MSGDVTYVECRQNAEREVLAEWAAKGYEPQGTPSVEARNGFNFYKFRMVQKQPASAKWAPPIRRLGFRGCRPGC